MKNHRVLADAFSGEVIELEAVISDKLKIHSDTILPVSLMLFPKVRKTTEKYADLPGRRAYMMHSVYFKLFDKI